MDSSTTSRARVDTNENLTRRILLLTESRALTNSLVRERVIRNVLARYVLHDRSVASKTGKINQVPHFLLNDVVRYWRTMGSDYASKMWERNQQGWATRNIKLRFSRKLLFIWGLLASFSGELFESDSEAFQQAGPEDERRTLLCELIRAQTDITPLELLARVATHESVRVDTSRDIFGAYNTFLAELSDQKKRKHLDALPFCDAAGDGIYDGLRTASNQFTDAIRDLFFDQHPDLKRLIRMYGVF